MEIAEKLREERGEVTLHMAVILMVGMLLFAAAMQVHHVYAVRDMAAEKTNEAVLALEELARRIQYLLDSGQAAVEPNLEHGYMFHLYQAEKAMRTGRYALACHELQDVIHFRHGISRQVLMIVLHQLQSYLEV